MGKRYSYFFTRQDLSPEQQLVQTAHVALKLGNNIGHDSDDIHFACIGVRNLQALGAVRLILDKFNYEYEIFIEPDLNFEVTAIAVYPIDENARGPLLAFNLLKIDKK